jgi:hypothetical protein
MTGRQIRFEAGVSTTFYADHGSGEWNEAWGLLAGFIRDNGLGDGDDLVQEQDGQGWQYLGSTRDELGDVHCFRHRYHPATLGRLYAHV